MVEISMAEYVTTVLLALANGLWIGCLFGKAWQLVNSAGQPTGEP